MSSPAAPSGLASAEIAQFPEAVRQRASALLEAHARNVALRIVTDDEKTDDKLLAGCQSQVWFVPEKKDGRLHFRAISDAAIVSGLIALLLRLYSGRYPQDILDTPPDFVTALELQSHLSPTRSTGLSSMLAAIRRFAAEALEAA